MALYIKHKEISFGIGDRIKVHQKIKEGEKNRISVFEGMVIKIKGELDRKMFTVRRIGEASVGIEKIFPLDLPSIEKIEITKKGTRGVKRAKLYYTRTKSTKEIEKIFKRSKKREILKSKTSTTK